MKNCGQRIFRDDNGIITKVLDTNGDPSQLYQDILNLKEIHGDKDLALRVWAKSLLMAKDIKYFDSKFSPSQLSDSLKRHYRDLQESGMSDSEIEAVFIRDNNIEYIPVTGTSGLMHYKDENPNFRALNGSLENAKKSLFDDRQNNEIVEQTLPEPSIDMVYSALFDPNRQGNVFNQLIDKDPRVNQYFSQILESSPVNQRETVEDLLNDSNRMELSDDLSHYILDGSLRLERTSNVISQMLGPSGEKDYFKFTGDSSKYENNREWGNLLDEMLSGIIQKKSKSDIIKAINEFPVTISEDAFDTTYKRFKTFVKANPNDIILTQVNMFNKQKGVGGALDVVAIKPNGAIEIVDLKSSINPTMDGKKHSKEYNRRFTDTEGNKHASTKEKHSAQQSMYLAMAHSKGYRLGNNPISILPLHLTETAGNTIESISPEHQFTINLNEEVFEAYKIDENISKTKSNEKFDSEFTKIASKLKEHLLLKIAKLEARGKITETSIISNLKESLDIVEKSMGVGNFVKGMHTQIFGNGTSFPGYKAMLNSSIQRINNSENIDVEKEIKKLQGIYDMVYDMLPENNPVIRDLIALYNERDTGLEPDKGSPLAQMKEIVEHVALMEKNHLETITRLQAKVIASTLDETRLTKENADTRKLLRKKERLEAKIATLGNGLVGLGRKKVLDLKIKDLKRQIETNGGKIINGELILPDSMEELVYQQLKDGLYNNISFLEHKVTSLSQNRNKFIAGFAKLLKERMEKARVKSTPFMNEASKTYNAYLKTLGGNRSNYAKINEPFYTTNSFFDKDGKETERRSFISPISYSAYNKALYKAKQDALKLHEFNSAGYNRHMKGWYKANRQARPQKSIILDGQILLEGVDTIVARKEKQLTRGDFKAWRDKNVTAEGDLIGELSIPNMTKFFDPKFRDLYGSPKTSYKSTTPKQKVYSLMIRQYFKAQSLLPEKSNEQDKFYTPSVPKGTDEKLLENNSLEQLKDNVVYSLKNQLLSQEEDIDLYGHPAKNSVHMKYDFHMDVKDSSLDLMQSVLLYNHAANEYEARNSLLSFGESLITTIKKSDNPFKLNAVGKRILKHNAHEFEGDDRYERVKNGENNVEKAFLDYFDDKIIGRTKIKQDLGPVDANKAAAGLMRYVSTIQMGPLKLTNIANALQANVMVAMEAIAGEYFDKSEWANALYLYGKYEAQLAFVNDRYRHDRPQSTIAKLIELYDPMREYNSSAINKMTNSTTKKLLDGAWFKAQEKGEHQAAATAMIAMLQQKKITFQGKQMSMLEVYEKHGVDAIEVDYKLMSKLHGVNKRLHGVYNQLDKTDIERHWLGGLIAMYRKFLVPGVQKRFKSTSFDEEIGDLTKGSYREFVDMLLFQRNELGKLLNPFNKESVNLTKREKANIKRAIFELTAVITVGVLSFALLKAGENDEELKKNTGYNLAVYFSLRLLSELKTYGMVGDINSAGLPDFNAISRTTNTVTLTESGFNKVVEIFKQFPNMGERYKRDSGVFNKGDLKINAKILKALGFNGHLYASEEARKLAERFYR